MTRTDIEKHVDEIITLTLVPGRKHLIHPDTTLIGDLGGESMDFLDLVFRLERKFGICIPSNEFFPDFTTDRTVDFLYQYIENKLKTKTRIEVFGLA